MSSAVVPMQNLTAAQRATAQALVAKRVAAGNVGLPSGAGKSSGVTLPEGGGWGYGAVEGLDGLWEIRTATIYDRVQMVAATAYTQVQVFAHSIGANGRSVTNLATPGALPGATAFRVRKIGVSTNTLASLANTNAVLDEGVLVLSVGGKQWFDAPLIDLPGGGGISGVGPAAAAGFGNGIGSHNAMLALRVPYLIRGGMPIAGEIDFTAAVTPAATDIFLRVRLWGEQLTPLT